MAAASQLEFGRARRGGDLDGQSVRPPTEVDLDAVGIRLERLDRGSLVDELAVRPDAERAVAGRQELHGRRFRQGDVRGAQPDRTRFRPRAILHAEARLGARREQGPPAVWVPGWWLEGLAGRSGLGDERSGRL